MIVTVFVLMMMVVMVMMMIMMMNVTPNAPLKKYLKKQN